MIIWKRLPGFFKHLHNFTDHGGRMMKKRNILFAVMAVFCIVGFLGLNTASARPLELNFNLFIHAKHERFVLCHKPWIENIDGVKIVNPGELCGMWQKPTFAFWDTKSGKKELKILEKIWLI